MSRHIATIALGICFLAFLPGRLIAAGVAPQGDHSLGDIIPLDENDLRVITLQVIDRNPLLASSPGIKAASAQRSVGTTDIAAIVFYPHAESAGIKYAFQVQCRRQKPGEMWACSEVQLRRYLQLESQDFEVRVVGNIGNEAALALIEATRGTALMSVSGASAIPEAAIIILPVEGAWLVGWGSDDGQSHLDVMANFRKGGNPARAEDWETSLFQPQQ